MRDICGFITKNTNTSIEITKHKEHAINNT